MWQLFEHDVVVRPPLPCLTAGTKHLAKYLGAHTYSRYVHIAQRSGRLRQDDIGFHKPSTPPRGGNRSYKVPKGYLSLPEYSDLRNTQRQTERR